jgi:BMFP domain-containing protein YqiC
LSDDKNVFERLRERGEEVFTQFSGELMSNPHFTRAVEGALRGKEVVESAVGRTVKSMNIPTRSELKKLRARVDTLEAEVAALKRGAAKAKAGARASGAKKAAAGKKKR